MNGQKEVKKIRLDRGKGRDEWVDRGEQHTPRSMEDRDKQPGEVRAIRLRRWKVEMTGWTEIKDLDKEELLRKIVAVMYRYSRARTYGIGQQTHQHTTIEVPGTTYTDATRF